MADNIKVVIKVRPLIKREIDDNLQKQWTVSENTIFPFEQSGRDGIGSFTFDHVFDDTSLTQDVYEKVARPIVEAAVEGMNGTIFAYGQTSSGKTYTMMGDAASPGVIPLAISNIFQTIESKIDRDFLLRVSYIEIYNERIRDLLDVSNVDLKIHEDFNGQVIVKCKEEVTSKPNQVLELMRKIIESRRHVSPGEEEENCVNVSQLNLVDLAGSERAGQTGATRLRLREGGHINKSLSTLGNVIRQLSDAQGDTNRFISFRDSKLTRILQTSLGGNAKTGIICAVTPAVLDETYSTLTFAMCAKAIENKPKVNAVMSDATQIKRLTKEMRNLQEELESKKHLEVDNKRLQEQLAILRDKILMGNSEEGSVQRAAALRRRTWCAPQRSGLPPILEHQPQPDFLWEKNKFKPGNNIQRLSNVTERDDESTVGSRDSITSGRGADTPVGWKNMAMGDVICLDDSEEVVNSPCNSPDHKCFGIHHTPPCVLRFRSHIAEKERKEIEELTTLENMYAPEKVELIQHIALLRSRQEEILSQKQATDKEYEKIQKEIAPLQESLDRISKDRDEANILRKKSEEEAKSLKCINTDLEFQIENLQIRTQNREKELVNCLKEAREEKERSQITQRRSSIPQFLNMSQDISLLANSDIESVHELSVENDTVKLKNVLSQKDLDMAVKDNCISELRERLKCITLEKESIESEHNAKLILIDSMEMQCIQKCEQTKLYSELKTKYENLIKELDKSNCKLLELTEENKSIFTYVNQIAELKDQLEKMAAQRESSLGMDGQKQSDRLNQLECLITNMQNEMTNYQQQLSERDLDISTKESELKSIFENNKTISDELLKVKESLFRTEAEKIKLINDVNVKNSQIEILTKDISEGNLQCSTVPQMNEELNKNLENVTRDMNDKNALVENLQQTLAELEYKLHSNEESQRHLSEMNEKLTKDISESNLQYFTISQINEELKKNLENVTRDLNDKNALVENLQQTLVELENKLQKNEELQRNLSEMNEKLTKDISESNLQYSTISQINEELKKNLENVTRDLNDKNALVENLQQTLVELENKLQKNEELQRNLSEVDEKLTKDISESNLQYSTISQINEELKKNLENVTRDLNDKNALVENLQQTLVELENKLQKNEELQRNLSEVDEKLTKDISESNLQYSTISQINEELKKNLENVTRDLNDKNALVENLQQTLVELENKLQKDEELQRNLSEMNEKLTKDISESNLQYSTISQINEELKKNLENVTRDLNDKNALVENLQQTLAESEHKLQTNEESQRCLSEMSGIFTKDISESNLQYCNVSQINEELKKNLENVTRDLNDKNALVENLQQSVIQLECKLQQNEESLNCLNKMNGQIESEKLYLETFLNEKCTEITELIEQTNTLRNNVKTMQSTIELKSQFLTGNDEEMHILKNKNNNYIILIEELKRASSKYDFVIQEKEHLIAELNSRILCLESDVDRVTESWEKSSQKMDDLQYQLEQALSHDLKGTFERLLSEISTLTTYLLEDEFFKSIVTTTEQEVDVTKNNIHLDIVQSENKDVINLCRALLLFKINITSIKTNFDNLNHLQTNMQYYESEIEKLKNIIETQNRDLIKSKIIKKEYEDLQYLFKDPYNDKENVKKSGATLTPLKKKKEDFIPSDSQLYLSPYSPLKLEMLKESVNLGKSPQATSPMKNKLDVKKVLELILNEINSNKESYKPINTSVLNIPELKFILEKLKELKMALTASVESNNLLQEKVLKLENINNELRTILKSTHLKMSNIDKIHSDIYNDSDVTFSGGTIDQYFDVFKHSIHDILSLKSVIQQSLTCVESENIYDDQSAIVKSKQEDVDMDPAHDESWTYSSVEESKYNSKQITFDLDKLDMFISLFETNMFEAYSLLEVCENDFSNSDETYKCGYNLESKLSKITRMHRFLIEKLKQLILSKNHDYEELSKQNMLLKNDMERCEKEVRELVSDTEELEKRVLHQRSETEVGYAEYSLLNSQYTTVQHHHSNLHSSCISTASYLREQLTHLQLTLLQTEKVNENHLSFDFSTPKKCPPSDAVSNLVIDNESIKTPVNLIPEIPSIEVDNTQYENLKIECEKLHSDVSAKCSEIRLLSDQLADHESLKRHYSQLQNEHDTLSTELMDCLQETDEIKKLYSSLKAELETVKYNENSKTTVNTSLQTDKVNMLDTSIQTSTCATNLESIETNTSVVVENVYDPIRIECEEFIKKYIYSMNEVIPDMQYTLLELLKLYVSVMEKRLTSLSYELTSMEDSNKCLQSDIIAKQNLLDEYQNNKILSLQEELLCKSSEMSTLQSEVLKHKEDLTNTLNMVQHLQDTNKLLKNEIEQQNNLSKALIKVHENEINKLETKEKDILNEYSEKEKDFINIIGSLKNELNDRVSEISHLQNEVKNKDNILNSLNEKYDNMCKTVSDVNFDFDKHKIELSALQLEISDTLGEKFQLKEEIHNSLQTIEQLKEELLTKSNQLAIVQKDNDALTDKETILSQSLDDINKNYAHLQSKFQDQEKALKEMLNLNDVISELQSQITTNREEKRKLSNDVKMLENEIQTLKLHIKQSDEELKTSEDQIKNLLQNNIILKQSEEELSKIMENAIKNLRNESEATIKQLKDNIVILNEQLKCKQNALDDHEIKFSELSKSFKERENLLEVISNKYEDDKKKNALQVASLEEELHKLNTDKILIEEERFSLLSNNDQMSCLLDEKDLEIESKADKIRKLEVTSRASTSLQFENQRLQTELQNQTDCVKGLQSKIKCLLETRSEESYSAQRLQELKVEHSRLSSTNHILENRVADLQAELSALLKSSPKMRHDLHLRRQSLHDLQRSLVQHGDNVKTSTEDNDVSMEDCSILRENSELKEKVKQLDLQLKAVKDRYTQLEQAHSDMTEEYQKIISGYNTMEEKLKEMHTVNGAHKPKQHASTNTNPDDKGALMSLFVDKMTHDFLNEKYKNLQKANEDYRMKNKEQTVELRRLQHSLQNNTMHTLLPRDESKNIIELQAQLKTLEQEIKLLRKRENEQTDWETKYKEMDVEYDVCVDQLKEANSSYNSLFSEKLLMEVELQNLKSELETAKRGSPGREIRRKRQSIYDANRGTSFTTADASTNTILDYPNQLSFTCTDCESTRRNLEEMKIRHAELEMRLNLQSAVVPIVLSPAHRLPGTGVVQAQKLHEYMTENQMLKLKLSKYKEYYYHRKIQQKLTQDNQNKK